MKAVLCPVCNGVGKVTGGFYNRGGDCPIWASSSVNPEICRSCNGKGRVEVSDDKYEPMFPIGNISYYPPYIDRCPACGAYG